MKVAITGGSGFVGRALADRLEEPVAISRRSGTDITDVDALTAAFAGCDAVAHCAGINREIGDQTFRRVHVEGTAAVVEAARRAGVRRLVMVSFLRARPDCGSAYHESKWEAEEIIRGSGLPHTILKSGMIYGPGDHMVDHVTRAVRTLPFFWTVGYRERTARPVPVEDAADVLVAALEGRIPEPTVAVMGADEVTLGRPSAGSPASPDVVPRSSPFRPGSCGCSRSSPSGPWSCPWSRRRRRGCSRRASASRHRGRRSRRRGSAPHGRSTTTASARRCPPGASVFRICGWCGRFESPEWLHLGRRCRKAGDSNGGQPACTSSTIRVSWSGSVSGARHGRG